MENYWTVPLEELRELIYTCDGSQRLVISMIWLKRNKDIKELKQKRERVRVRLMNKNKRRYL